MIVFEDTLIIVYFGKKTKYLKKNEVIIINRQKLEICFTFRKEIEKLFLLQLIKNL